MDWKQIFKAEILRFLSSSRTQAYEQETSTWWTRDDLKLVVTKAFASDVEPERLFPLADAAIDELAKEKKITGTPSGYKLDSGG